jgi:hypothetical protein
MRKPKDISVCRIILFPGFGESGRWDRVLFRFEGEMMLCSYSAL